MIRPLTLLLAAAAAGCAADATTPGARSTATRGEIVPGEVMLGLVRGNTMRGETANGAPFAIHTLPDDRQRIRVIVRDGAQTDQGRATLVDGLLCNQWGTLRGGRRQCAEMRRDGDTFRSYVDGALSTTFTILPGNPEGL